MGYESRVYIVEKSEYSVANGDGKVFGDVIAKFNLSKMGSFASLFKYGDSDCYIYDGDGDSPMGTDSYGAYLQEGNIDEVKAWLKAELKRDDYRRIRPLYNCLQGFKKRQWKNLVILHYGY